MPIDPSPSWLPKSLNVLPPEDRLLAFFGLIEEAHGKDCAEVLFKSIQETGRGLSGLIIVRYGDSDDRPEWWSDSGGPFGLTWTCFGDPTCAEVPPMYRTLKGARKAVRRLTEEGFSRVGLAVWSHPDSHAAPIGKYIELALARKAPGSVQQ